MEEAVGENVVGEENDRMNVEERVASLEKDNEHENFPQDGKRGREG